ncbi:hypothetical protein KIN20_006499 [Parelaphostrongylus tenuis]|uniref:Uncharacterized protein n=1 Tax=Parelaphostrongylus tenuis TaxID=148309 RepID=A0AAD5M672_PARTN|nr:hypothetical protein KIN20_006499 [Parelaphostrongylus tenuis]
MIYQQDRTNVSVLLLLSSIHFQLKNLEKLDMVIPYMYVYLDTWRTYFHELCELQYIFRSFRDLAIVVHSGGLKVEHGECAIIVDRELTDQLISETS